MKNKKIIYGVGIAILLYFLFKNKKVVQKAKEVVKPKKILFKGKMIGDPSTQNKGKQLVIVGNPRLTLKTGDTKNQGGTFVDLEDGYFIENSKGEVKKLLSYNISYVKVDADVSDDGMHRWLDKGEDITIFKT